MKAGVRNLEREIANICRAVASMVAEGKIKSKTITVKDIHKYLGPVSILTILIRALPSPAFAIGLAWTPAGGDMLFIEATAMKGKNGLTLTGQLGDVNERIGECGFKLIRSNAAALGCCRGFL